MAAPHGDTAKNLNTGFIESLTAEVFSESQVGFPRSYNLELDDVALGNTSSTFHSNLEPSILSIFKESSSEEEEIQIDVENEASLLSAFSEMLDSVIEDTLSPFDTLPDSKLFVSQRSQASKLRLQCMDREAAPRFTRSLASSNSKAAILHSDRQLRPRLHRKTQSVTAQRSDGEEEDLRETRRRPVRIFRIESDPALYGTEQPDEFLPISLVELVRHMHPYSIRVAMDKKEGLRNIQELQEDDVFVDIEGDDTEETPLGELLVPHSQNPSISGIVHISSQEDMLKICSSNYDEQKKVPVKVASSRKTKKKVRFAHDVASIHIYQVEDEAVDWDVPHTSLLTEHTENLKISHENSQTADFSGNMSWVTKPIPSQNSNTKHKTLSLQEYRLLRQKTLPKEVKKTDYRTKWPSVPETPKELPPIPCIPGYNTVQVNILPPPNPRPSTRGAVVKPRRNLHLPLRSLPRQNALVRKPVQSVDPPNPVTVSLPPAAKILLPQSGGKKVMQKKYGKSQAGQTNLNHPAAVQSTAVKDSSTNCLTISGNASVPFSPVTVIPVHLSQGCLPQVQTAVSSHTAEGKQQKPAAEIGIEATDVTSLLEQFETQGLTPPATPPHQIWNPTTTLKLKQHEATKPSPSKTIQIIEPKPLPPSKIQAKSQHASSIPAPSLFLAFIDHDYCITQDFRLSKKRALSDVHMHKRSPKESRNHRSHILINNRTSCERECLSGSVLLSPEASPPRFEARGAGEPMDTEVRRHSHCTCSSNPPARGRTRRRHYHGRYLHYDSSSVSSSHSSSSSSSASSCSPPRKKRYRSRHSESNSSSSSRSSSQSLSPSPIRGSQWRYHRSQSRSFSPLRSRSCSPQPDWRRTLSSWKRPREYGHRRLGKDTQIEAKQKAIEERRVVYVGKIRSTMTKDELRERFALFGKIEDCTVHFRNHRDNYGFVTFYNTDDAFAAIEKGKKLRQPDELPFDICFGGRRQFCKSNYMDLDSKYDMDPALTRSKDNALDFDTLLKQAQRGLKT